MTHREFAFPRAMSFLARVGLLTLAAPVLCSIGCATELEDPTSLPSVEQAAGDLDDLEVDFAPERANGLVVDEFGTTIGYVDSQLRARDLEGKLVPEVTSSALEFFSSPQRVLLYSDANFFGTSTSYYNGSTTFSVNLNDYHNNKLSSIVAAPGCKVALYDGANQTGTLLYTVNPNQGGATYVNLGSGLNDRATSMAVTCRDTAHSLCGYLYEHADYGGNVFPVYSEHRYLLSNFVGWNDFVSSVAFNPYKTCDGIGMWQHSDAFSSTIRTDQKRLLRQGSTSNLHNFGMGDQVTAIEADRELAVGEATNSGLGRLLTELQKQRSWGKAFTCDLMESICVDNKSLITGLTSVAGFYICAKLIGSSAITALQAGGITVGSGGAAAPVAAGLAAYSATELTMGIGCLAVTGLAVLTESAACNATMETYCNSYTR